MGFHRMMFAMLFEMICEALVETAIELETPKTEGKIYASDKSSPDNLL